MSRSTSFSKDHAATLLRIALGVVFIAHAGAKWFTFTLPGTVEFFASQGFPGWSAYPVFAAELIGGIALVLGLGTRWVALSLVPVMLGALAVHWPNGWDFTAPNGGWEYVAFLTVALLVQAGLGDGAMALGSHVRGAGGIGLTLGSSESQSVRTDRGRKAA